jgi:uncharacterized membrane protein
LIYPLLKWLHILLAIAALGTNLTYGIWIRRASQRPEALPFVLRGIKILDDRIANPAYGLLLVTGVGLVQLGRWPFTTPWILMALALYGIVVLLALFGYTPTLRRQIQLVESGGHNSPGYAALARRGTILGILLAVLVVAITFLMVVKPGV